MVFVVPASISCQPIDSTPHEKSASKDKKQMRTDNNSMLCIE